MNDKEFVIEFGEALQIVEGISPDTIIDDACYLFYKGARLKIKDTLLPLCKNLTSISSMFNSCYELTSLDLSSLDTTNVTSMDGAFNNCVSLAYLNLDGWKTSKVTTMSNMFCGCKRIEDFHVSDWDVSNVGYMANMFDGCLSMKRFDMSKWDTRNVKNMTAIFGGCSGLMEIIGFSAPAINGQRIGFPSGYEDERYALKRLTFRTDVENPIRSDIDVSYCSFERAGFVEMFNSLPDISSSDEIRRINITGNPCVAMPFSNWEDIDGYIWGNDLVDKPCLFEFEGKRYEMDGEELLRFMGRYINDAPFDFKLLSADVELLTDEDRKIARRKGWTFIE